MSVGVAVLGSTGSIGRTTLEVLGRHRDRFHVVALTAGSNADLLDEQARAWERRTSAWRTGLGAGASWRPRPGPTRGSW
jgi:1-deoxy-D-xylulose 5-phosphate reductoisomerase